MIDQQFDHIVSLGSHCETAYHIRRRFGCRTTHLFDWLVAPTRALVDMIQHDFADMFVEENMRVIFEADGVLCGRYGTVHFHDFTGAKPEGKYIPALVAQDCARNRQKFGMLAQRFRSLNGRVLFIRVDDGFVFDGDRNGDFDDALFGEFTAAIEAMLPQVDYQILLLRGSYRGQHPRLHVDVAEKYGETIWNGSDRGWDEMFDRQQIRWAGAPSAAAEPSAPTGAEPTAEPARIDRLRADPPIRRNWRLADVYAGIRRVMLPNRRA